MKDLKPKTLATKKSRWAYALIGLVSVALLAMAWMAYVNPQIFRAFTGGFGGGSYNPPATGGGMPNTQGGLAVPNIGIKTPQVGLQGTGTKTTPAKLEMPNPDGGGGGAGGGLPPLPKVTPMVDLGVLPASELKKQVVGGQMTPQIPEDVIRLELPPLYLTLDPDDAPTAQLPGSVLKFVVAYNMDEATILSDCGDSTHIGLMDGANFIKVDSRTTLGGTYSNVEGEGPTFRFDNHTLPTTLGGHDFKAVCMERKTRKVIHGNQTVNEIYYEAKPDLASGILHIDVNLCGSGAVLGWDDYGTCELKPEVTCYSDMDCVLTPGGPGGVCEHVEECDNGGLCADNATPCKSNADCSSVGGSCTPRSGDGCSNECKVERGYSCTNTVHQIGVEIPVPVLQTDACVTTCGDSIKSGAEQCDKTDLGAKTCNNIVAGSIGTLACNNTTQANNCTFNTSGCYVNPCNANACNTHGTCTDNNGTAVCACTGNWTGSTCSSCKPGFSGPNCAATPVCGDNVKNRPEEECDGTDLAGKTCADVVGVGSEGSLACVGPTPISKACKFDVTACSPAACVPATCFTDVDASKVDDYLLGLYTLTAAEMTRYDTNCSGTVTDGDAGYIADHASATCP